MRYFFIRVNGETGHNNPNELEFYVLNEPPEFPSTYFNYFNYCLKNNIVRVGWPDIGDIIKGHKYGALKNAYSIDSDLIKTAQKGYLKKFSKLKIDDVILMPDKDNPGNLCIGKVNKTYEYFYDIPQHPYECAHRVGVNWNSDNTGEPIIYNVSDVSIPMNGWWVRAFHEIKNEIIIDKINLTFPKESSCILVNEIISDKICQELIVIAKEIRRNSEDKKLQPQPPHIFMNWEKLNGHTLDNEMREQLIKKCFRKK